MSLRHKLVVLLSAFAVFTVGTAATVIYGVQWRVERAVDDLERTLGRTLQVDRLRVSLREQTLRLRGVIDGDADAARAFFASRDEFAAKLAQVTSFRAPSEDAADWPPIQRLAESLSEASERCLALVQGSHADEARRLLTERIEREVMPELDSRLLAAKTRLDEARNRSTRALAATSSQTLSLTLMVAAAAAGLVVVGAILIRRWLIVPVLELRQATDRFSRGDFDYRVGLRSGDELGALGDALNGMARSVADAQDRLRASETKHRLLFQNLRDAVIICDIEGRIVECHDSDAKVLGVEGDELIGRRLIEVWPEWARAADWPAVIGAAVGEGRRFRVEGAELASGSRAVLADLVVYRVEYGEARYAAIIIRDVTERQKLQTKLRHAETMEAVGTLAGGLAHDFNNLLAGVIGSLTLVANEVADSGLADRLRSAVQTCWQAAGLSRRLLNFAGSARGEPQVFLLGDAVRVMVNSLDPSFLEGIDLHVQLDLPLNVRLDRDQFTQVVLNLLRNAREAMPEGGSLWVCLETANLIDPEDGRTHRRYGVLVVRDTGCGMTPEAQRRIFEPFFTTKSRSSRRGRGMGMAVAYTAVRNAGGFIQIESAPGKGSTFRVHLPLCEAAPTVVAPAAPSVRMPKRSGAILLVEEDAVLREVARQALEAGGHSVVAVEGAREAFAASPPGGATIDLAIVNVDAPEGDNATLCAMLVSANPALRLIFTTAGQEATVPERLEPHVAAQLLKPFALESLASAVSAALSPSSARN